jgi:signal transduction histidine kinase
VSNAPERAQRALPGYAAPRQPPGYDRELVALACATRSNRLARAAIAREIHPVPDATLRAALEAHTVAPEQIDRVRQQERRRLSRELHDGVGAALAGVIMVVGAAQAGVSPGVSELLAGVERDLVEVARELRSLIEDLRPPALQELGLTGAVRRHAGRLAAGSRVTIAVHEEPELGAEWVPASVEHAAYRIVTEALTNVGRHARATRCEVTLAREDGALHVTVCDDGIGLPALHRDGVGLAAIRERAAELDGRCEWHARPGGGTRLECHLPLTAP